MKGTGLSPHFRNVHGSSEWGILPSRFTASTRRSWKEITRKLAETRLISSSQQPPRAHDALRPRDSREKTTAVPQSPYGPDFLLPNIFLFPKLKVISRYESAAEKQ